MMVAAQVNFVYSVQLLLIYPVLVTLLRHVYKAIKSYQCVHKIDKALCAGDFQSLMEITKPSDFEALLRQNI